MFVIVISCLSIFLVGLFGYVYYVVIILVMVVIVVVRMRWCVFSGILIGFVLEFWLNLFIVFFFN